MKSTNRGFTLIELLVVISIIGTLSSIILVSLQNTRDKGRVASGIIFSTHVYRGYGDNALGLWKFENNTLDESQYGDGIPSRIVGSPVFVSDTYNNKGFAISLNGVDQYVDAGNPEILSHIDQNKWIKQANAALPSGLFDISEGTVSVWFKATGNAEDYTGYRGLIVKDYSYGLLLYDGFPALQDWMYSGGIQQTDIYVADNKWHHVAMSFKLSSDPLSGPGTATIYLDGKIVLNGVINTDQSSNSLNIGTTNGNGGFFKGYLDDATVYPSALTAMEIQNIYAQGVNDRNIATK